MTNRPLTSTPIALMRALQRTHAQWPLQSADCGTGLQRQRVFLLANGQTALENWAYTATGGLQCKEAVVDLDLLGDEIRADGGLLLDAELVDVTARTKPRIRSSLISTEN
ncbi:unnamed protein product [Miscanthus lutarioriparius]|uniref:Uncharacterized protein n=1 Tax=Miscanthus lutarioriparius TaxID=422564 RepID=A0A811PC34_9POAL|nr:unnamed protein product [Miscanthus lutarioriparius]